MMIHFEYLKNEIVFDDEKIQLLVIENKELFRSVLLVFEQENADDMFVFSDNLSPFEFSKYGCFIPTPLFVDFQNKKLVSKLNSFLAEAANNEFQQEFAGLKSNIMSFAEQLGNFSDYDFEWCDDIDASSIVKLLQFKIDCQSQSPLELFVTYVLLLSKYLGVKIFVVANLHMYFTDAELSEVYKTLLLYHINLLAVEPSAPNCCNALESVHIIDSDLCYIDSNIIK